MKFLILGCNGMAGHIISLYLKERGHYVVGFAKEKSKYINSIEGDATDTDFLKKVIKDGQYDTVINCIGILNKDAENNKELAVFLNSYLPHFLAHITKDTKTQIIHMSTDCVFSGKKGQYAENDFTDGETFYDRSKALGELNDDKNLTLRNSIVGPDINQNGIGLLNWFMAQKENVNGFTKAIWTGQTTLQLAKTMEYAALTRANGLINAVPAKSISKYKLLQLFNHYLRDNKLQIHPVKEFSVDKSLKRTNFDMEYVIPDYETMIKELADWIRAHKDLYSHYNL